MPCSAYGQQSAHACSRHICHGPHRVPLAPGSSRAHAFPPRWAWWPDSVVSGPHRIMHDEVSETENIRKNLAIERMIIEGCEILLDTSQTFVRQGTASALGGPQHWGQGSPGASPLDLAATPTSVMLEDQGLLGTVMATTRCQRLCV